MKNGQKNGPNGLLPHSVQARIFLSYSSQCQTSEMRVSLQTLVKKTIIMRICENNAYLLTAMDQDADSVWVMTLNWSGL